MAQPRSALVALVLGLLALCMCTMAQTAPSCPAGEQTCSKGARDFNAEGRDAHGHQYYYDFDGILRRYMVRAWEPFVREGRVLELGSYRGEMTELFAQRFPDLTGVEAGSEYVEEAKRRLPHVKFVLGEFDTVVLEGRFDTIFLVHTLEHVEDPVALLQKIRRNWLAPGGRLIVAVPNANSASRQIAVYMRKVHHQTAITPGEKAHGHFRTYTMDVLEADAVDAGFRIVHRTGVIFKPLGNAQFDDMLSSGKLDEAYLESCFKMGFKYPDLSASLVLVLDDPDASSSPSLANRGWMHFPGVVGQDLLESLRSDLARAEIECEKARVAGGVAEESKGSAHHLLTFRGAFLTLLERLPLNDELRAFFEGDYRLNSFGASINRPDTVSYLHSMHRDQRRYTRTGEFLNMLVMLDDFTEANGATLLLDGSHLERRKPSKEEFEALASRGFGKAGDIILFDGRVWHAAGNSTGEIRRCLTLTFTPPDRVPQFDYPRALGYNDGESFDPALRRVIGYDSRVPATLEEWYRPKPTRLNQT